MIASPNVTADTMKKALAYSIAALTAASELDVDRTEEDRVVFAREKDALTPHLQSVLNAARAEEDEELNNSVRLQARVTLGDAVLDRGVVDGKERMKVELKRSAPDAADQVFGKRVADTTRAPILTEPALVSAIIVKLDSAPSFPQKESLRLDLEKRMTQQNICIQERAAGDLRAITIRDAVVQSIRAASDALYGLEKRLLERFKRENEYVKKFFLDVGYTRTSKEETTPTPTNT